MRRALLLLLVGCGLFGPSTYATRLAEHMGAEADVPCEALAKGSTARLGDWEVRFLRPELVTPETRSPWIRSATEREAFEKEGTKALIVVFERKNTAPVQQKDRLKYELRLPDGSEVESGTSQTVLWNERAGTEQPAERGDSPSDAWVKSALAYPIDPEVASDAVMYVTLTESVKKPELIKRVESVVAHVVVDLGRPAEGESLVQASEAP